MPKTAALRVLKSIGRRKASDSGQRVTQKVRVSQLNSTSAGGRPVFEAGFVKWAPSPELSDQGYTPGCFGEHIVSKGLAGKECERVRKYLKSFELNIGDGLVFSMSCTLFEKSAQAIENA